MEDITDAEYMHAKRVHKDFESKKLGEYHDVYVQSDALLLAEVFENFRNVLKYVSLILQNFLQLLQLRKTKPKLDPLTDIDMLLMGNYEKLK